MKVFDDDHVQAELDGPPLQIDRKIELLSSLLKTVQQATKWNNEPRYSQATVRAVRAEYEYWKRQKEERLTRDKIFIKAQELKNNGMSVPDTFDEISQWLLEDLGLSKEEVKKRFNFSLEDPHSFIRLVNKHMPYHN
jgi:hypothetical protein